MSWALEEWKEGLPSRALQKIQELEVQLDKLKKEKQQRQFQLDTLEAALQKQKQKVETEKNEGTNLKRENQRLMEICENLEKSKQKISHELQVKETQVNFQEGQLNAGKKQIEHLEQELKRCKSELERSQQATQPADVSLGSCITPQKIFATPLTPSQHYSGSKYEDLKEKYSREVEERKRLEVEVKALQAKVSQKASQAAPQATMNHRDIARHQASSSVFSWQQDRTPQRLSCHSQKTPSRRNFSSSHIFGQEEVTPSRSILQTGKRDANSSSCDPASGSPLLDQLEGQNQELRSKVNELELRLQGQEKEMKGHAHRSQELQLQLEKTKAELMEKDKVLNKNRDELGRMTAQYDQAAAKCSALEQKLKKLTEDLSCQRQNAESARCSLEQRIKEKEKELQEELSRQQRAFQTLEQEFVQTKARLTQELQQARNALRGPEAELDRVTAVKQQLEKNLEEFKQKFSRMEQASMERQEEEAALRRSSEEMKKENAFLRNQSEQRAREVSHLEEELQKVRACLSQSQNFAEELRAKNTSQETVLRELQEKINQQENSLTLEKLKLALADLEKQRDCSQDLLKKRECHIEQLNERLSKTEKESKTLLSALESTKKEYEALNEEKTQFSHWKSENEKLLHQMESDKEGLQSKINHLETCLKTQQIKSHEYNERVRTLEMERDNLGVEMRNLRNLVDSKMREVETQKQAYEELQQKAERSDQKHKKEIENLCLKTSQLTAQVEDLEQKLQRLSSELMDKDRHYQDLQAECESLRDLLKSRDSAVPQEDQQSSCLAFEQKAAMNTSLVNVMGEQGSNSSDRSQWLLDADASPRSLGILQNRVVSLESSLESQKQMNSDLQKQCEELVYIKEEEIEENLNKAEQMHESFVAETSQRICQLQEDTSVHQSVITETLVALEHKEKELELWKARLEAEQAEIQELKKSNQLLEDSLKELQLLSETLSSEKKEMSSIISLSKKEIEELARENGTLKDMNEILNQEKINLLQKNEKFSNCIEEQEKSISELSAQYKQETLILLQRCEETGRAFEDLGEKYKAAQEKNSRLECLLSECTSVCESRKNELEQLKETSVKEHQEFLTKLAFAEEQNQKLILEFEVAQQALKSEMRDLHISSKSEADGLKQEIMTLKEEQNKMQKEVNDLLQENQQLVKLTKTKHEDQHLKLEPVRDSVKETEDEINACSFQLQMDPGDRDAAPSSYNAQLVQLEAMIRNMELKLEECEKEKEHLQQELQTLRGDLGAGNVHGCLPQEMSDLTDGEVDAEGKYSLGLCELSPRQGDSAQVQCSLQAALSKLEELEKICEVLQVEKLQLVSELNNSRSECITATSKMAGEVEKLVNEMKILNDDSGLPRSESVEESLTSESKGQQNEQTPVSLMPLDDSNSYEQLTLSSKEVQTHFAELQEKFSSLQSEHKILHDQHCQMSSKMSELQSYVDTLKAENSALSMNLRNLQVDLAKEMKPEGPILSLSFSCVTDSPSTTSVGESSFYRDALEHIEGASLLNHLGESVSANTSLEEERTLSTKEVLTTPEKNVEELETLCQGYLQSLKNLEEKMESQAATKDKEIQELGQLLSSERTQLDSLRKQYLSQNEEWQRKLTSVTLEMESKLAAEKRQTEHLVLELEVARLQLQALELSSQSLLGADIEGAIEDQNDGCALKELEENTSEITEETPQQDNHQICEEAVRQDLHVETEVASGTLPVTPGAGERPSETSDGAAAGDKSQGCLEHTPELLSCDSHALVPMEFVENHVSIQHLQLQVKETVNENLRLCHAVEDQDRKVQSLLSEIKDLGAKLESQELQLKTKIEICLQLERIVEELQKEKCDLTERLEAFLCAGQELGPSIETSQTLSSNLEMGTNESSEEVVEENVTKVDENWKERFLHLEDELDRIKAENARAECRALALETDLEVAQTEKLCLEKENENNQKAIVRLEEELSVATSERKHLDGELEAMKKENQTLTQMGEIMKEKVQVLEAEIRDKAAGLEALSSQVSQLLEDKGDLQERLQRLEGDSQALSSAVQELESQVRQLEEEKASLVREAKSLEARLRELEQERLIESRALEVARLEKDKFAERLCSTQEEVHQLREGMEKLRVRIEADEKRQLDVLQKLRGSERENDVLRDKVEGLQRELQMSEENQELVILDAENAKAEVEILRAQVEEVGESLRDSQADLAVLRSEKGDLAKQLQEKQGHVEELEALVSSLRSLVEEKERARVQMQEDSKTMVETIQAQLRELTEEVAASCEDHGTPEAREENLDTPGSEVARLRGHIGRLRACVEADRKEQLQVLEQLKESQCREDLLKGRVEGLERELELSGRDLEQAVREAENSRAEVQTLKAEVQELSQHLRDLEADLVNIKSEKEKLTKGLREEQAQVSELEILNSSLEKRLQEKEDQKVQMREESETAMHMLQAQIKLLTERTALSSDLEACKIKEQTLSSQVDSLELEKAQLLRDLETKEQTLSSQVDSLELEKAQLLQDLETKEQTLSSQVDSLELEKAQLLQDLETKEQTLSSQVDSLELEKAQLLRDLETKEQTLSSRVDSLELEKAQLLQDLEEAKHNYIVLQSSVNSLMQEAENSKQKLEEKEEELSWLKGQVQDREQLASKLAQVEGEQQRWQEQKAALGTLAVELEQKVQELQSKNHALQDSFEVLQNSCKELESELTSTRGENTSLVEKVSTLTAREAELQGKVQDMAQKTTKLEEEYSGEKTRLTEKLNALLEEVKSSKADHLKYVDKLKKENERALGKIKLLLKSCKQLEEEKKMLQKELSQLEAAQKQNTGAALEAEVEELTTEIRELKEALEEKAKEADEYLDKYCSLLISHEKLERAKEMLETQVTRLSSQPAKLDPSGSPLASLVTPGPSAVPSAGERKMSSGRSKAAGKRQRSSGAWESGGGLTPATLETFPKKSRKAIRSGSPHPDQDEEEFEPEGLPEVVKKGFADIPSGKTSPYVLRRTTMATRTSPRLAAQKSVLSPQSVGKENLAKSPKPTAGGSRSQKVKFRQKSPAGFAEPTVKPVSAGYPPGRSTTHSPRDGPKTRGSLLIPTLDARPDPPNSENCRVQ
ncbi:centromere protein F isoform X3 [Cavia porcellus]|uniref:centromere protein F isoform X3 n=1 Tax=Cavia porcellus TaxID=10141 RepID=UPI002FE17C63